MSCYKFSLLFFLVINVAFAQKFDSEQCMQSKFETKIENSGQFFGLIKNELTLKKDACVIEVRFLKIKWLSDKIWKIDICREPIHIKVQDKGSESFHKRIADCSSKADNSFCVYWEELKDSLEDYGLIYAKGERESLETSHGQTYCLYLLLKKYLDEGLLFSKYDKPHPLFEIKKKEQSTQMDENIKPLRPEIKNEEIGAENFSLEESKPEATQFEAEKADYEQEDEPAKPRF